MERKKRDRGRKARGSVEGVVPYSAHRCDRLRVCDICVTFRHVSLTKTAFATPSLSSAEDKESRSENEASK